MVGIAGPAARNASARRSLLPRHDSGPGAMSFGPIVSPEWLHEHVHDPDLRVVDFRWSLLGGSGREAYARGHIPGSVFVELDAVTGRSGGGRHPLPTGAQFEDEMRKAGISSNTRVVVYDDSGGSVASRLWFLLRWFGHDAQAVLDGGIGPWGGGLGSDKPAVAGGEFRGGEAARAGILGFEDRPRLTGPL